MNNNSLVCKKCGTEVKQRRFCKHCQRQVPTITFKEWKKKKIKTYKKRQKAVSRWGQLKTPWWIVKFLSASPQKYKDSKLKIRANTHLPFKQTCLVCGSSNIHLIDPINRELSRRAFGTFSTLDGKVFECGNCGYTW